MYEPEQFPGLMYRMEEPRAVVLVFGSGKLVCTGAKRETDVYRAIEKIRQKLEDCEAPIYDEPGKIVTEKMLKAESLLK